MATGTILRPRFFFPPDGQFAQDRESLSVQASGIFNFQIPIFVGVANVVHRIVQEFQLFVEPRFDLRADNAA